MVARPLNDPTSWGFQANVHGMPRLRTNPPLEALRAWNFAVSRLAPGLSLLLRADAPEGRRGRQVHTPLLGLDRQPHRAACVLRPGRRHEPAVSSINFFGKGSAADHEHASATFDQTLDATATIAHLRELGAWDLMHISVTLRPVTVVAPRDMEIAARDRAAASAEAAQISYKRVNLRIAP